MDKKNNLFKEAIADAKLLKETAIANAKLSMEESLAPRLQQMFSSKIEEMENEEEESDELNLDELISELEEGDDPKDQDWHGSEFKKKDKDLDEAEGDETETEAGEGEAGEDEEEEINLEDMSADDLKDFVKEVVEELVAAGEINLDDEAIDTDAEATEDTEEVAEAAVTESDDEEIDIEELLAEVVAENKKLKKPQMEAKKAAMKPKEDLAEIAKVKKELQESQLFASKLLFTNKILVAKNNLTETQKVSILENLDKAKTPKEAKIIFEALQNKLNKKQIIKESKFKGGASKAIISNFTKKQDVIASNDAVLRMQKLAGII
jgi:hypothetical protein